MNIFEFDSELIFAILNGKVSLAINRKLYRNFKKAGIEVTPEQWTILVNLWSKEGVTQQDLCNATFKDKPSMTRLINNLEKLGLAERRSNDSDKRINRIYLTSKGKKLEKKVNQVVLQTIREAFTGIEEQEITAIKVTLRKIFENVRESMK